jgi:hypothetical protein
MIVLKWIMAIVPMKRVRVVKKPRIRRRGRGIAEAGEAEVGFVVVIGEGERMVLVVVNVWVRNEGRIVGREKKVMKGKR